MLRLIFNIYGKFCYYGIIILKLHFRKGRCLNKNKYRELQFLSDVCPRSHILVIERPLRIEICAARVDTRAAMELGIQLCLAGLSFSNTISFLIVLVSSAVDLLFISRCLICSPQTASVQVMLRPTKARDPAQRQTVLAVHCR